MNSTRIDVQPQQRPTVRPVWGSQPSDDPNITSYAADVELQNYLDVDAQEAPSDVGVALHSSTSSSLSSHRIAVLSAKNVQWLDSHRPAGLLESLADRNVAVSAVSSDLSPDSAVTPMPMLPWFQITFFCEVCAGAAKMSPNSHKLRKPIPYFQTEGDSVLVARFLDHAQDEIRNAARGAAQTPSFLFH